MRTSKSSRTASLSRLIVVAVALTAVFPLRHAAADDLPPISQGTGGPSGLGGPTPSANSVEANASVDVATGAAHATIPFAFQRAVGGAQPTLSLEYNSESGVGFAGVGWTINLPSIERRGVAGLPKYNDNDALTPDDSQDRFVFAGKPLVPICRVSSNATCAGARNGEVFPATVASWVYFRQEVDDGARFFWSADHQTWIAQLKGGAQLQFGAPLDTTDPAFTSIERADANQLGIGNDRVHRWNLVRQFDATGNGVYYVWQYLQRSSATQNDGIEYLTDIYDSLPGDLRVRTPDTTQFLHHIHLRWAGFTPDAIDILSQSPIGRMQPAGRLVGVDVTSKPIDVGGTRELVRRYHLEYTSTESQTRFYLAGVFLEGRCGGVKEDGAGLLPDQTTCPTLPKTTLTYEMPTFSSTSDSFQGGSGQIAYVDLNGDAVQEIVQWSGGNLMVNGFLTNMESRDSSSQRVAKLGDIAVGGNLAILGDWTADGGLNVLWLKKDADTPLNSAFEVYSLAGSTWTGRGPFPVPSNYAYATDWVMKRAMDVDGDGLTDMGFVPQPNNSTLLMSAYLTTRDATGITHPFSVVTPPTCAPPGISLDTRAVADMDGDGLADIVALNNDNIPNIGTQLTARIYKNRGDGRFGSPGPHNDPCFHGAGDPLPRPITHGTYWLGDPVPQETLNAGAIALHDLDGDGFADLVFADANGIEIRLHTQGADGVFGHWQSASPQYDSYIHIEASQVGWTPQTFNAYAVAFSFADLHGTGIDNVIVRTSDGFAHSISIVGAAEYLKLPRRRGLLVKMANGLGAETTYTYAPIASLDQAASPAWKSHLPRPAMAVTSVSTSNGLTGSNGQTYVTSYAYADPIYDARLREFFGFQTVTVKRPGDAAAPGTTTTTRYATATCSVSPAAPCTPTASYWYRARRGLPLWIQTATEDGKPLVTTVNFHAIQRLYTGVDGRHVRMPYLAQTDVYVSDPAQPDTLDIPASVVSFKDGDSYVDSVIVPIPKANRHLKRTAYVDDHGDIDWSVDWGDPAKDTPIRVENTWGLPASDTTGWNYRVLVTYQGYADSAGATIVSPKREAHFDYDWRGFLLAVSAPLSGTAPLARANAAGTGVAPAPNDASTDTPPNSYRTLATYVPDSRGNVAQVAKPGGRCSATFYDAYGLLPIESRAYRGGCGVDPLVTKIHYDPVLQLPTATLGAAGDITVRVYDAFGRVTEIDEPSADSPGQMAPDAAVLIDYSLATAAPIARVGVRRNVGAYSAQYSESWHYYDAFGDELFSAHATDAYGEWLVQGAHRRSANGRVLASFNPVRLNASAGSAIDPNAPFNTSSATATYDALGRVLASTDLLGNKISQFAYYPLQGSYDVRDGEQQQQGGLHPQAYSTVYSDGHGRMFQSVRHDAQPVKDDITTTLTMLASGEPTDIVSSHTAGADTTHRVLKYDSWGRLVQNFEPNTSKLGTNGAPDRVWMYAFNDNGDLVGTSDARGCGENLTYDRLGRLVSEDYSPCTINHLPYSDPNAPNALFGSGLESHFQYDQPEVPAGPTDIVYLGRLASTYDRAQHTRLTLDARGRVRAVDRQIAKSDVGDVEFAARYAPHRFHKDFTYDLANRVIEESTGADAPELLPPPNYSNVYTTYSMRGLVRYVDSGYGGGHLLSIEPGDVDDLGVVRKRTLGDSAQTTAEIVPDANGRAVQYWLHRVAGPWVAPNASYSLPSASDPNVLEGDLTHLTINYDKVGNATSVTDTTSAQWPSTFGPRQSQTFAFDDEYRLASVGMSYASGMDYGASGPRLKQQTFQYDWLGNISVWKDDANKAPTRSLGTLVNGPTANVGPNQLATATASNGWTTAVQYDDAGNVTSFAAVAPYTCNVQCGSAYELQWDEVGRLQHAKRTDTVRRGVTRVIAEYGYRYTASGERILRTAYNTDGGAIANDVFVFDSLRLAAATFPDANGDYDHTALTEHVYANSAGMRVAHVFYTNQAMPSVSGGKLHVFLYAADQVGSTNFVIDRDSGELVEAIAYQPYGSTEEDFRTLRWANYRDAIRFTGHEDDSDVGLVYHGQRYYAPMLGRWVSPDPLQIHGLGGDPNPYAYANGSPTRYYDPTGLNGGEPSWDPACDNLSRSCATWYGVDPAAFVGWLAGVIGGGDAPAGGGGRGGSRGGTSNPPTALPSFSNNGQVPLWQVFNNPWMLNDMTLPSSAVDAFNQNISRRAPYLVGAAALNGAGMVGGVGVAGEAIGGLGTGLYSLGGSFAHGLTGVVTDLALAEQGWMAGGAALGGAGAGIGGKVLDELGTTGGSMARMVEGVAQTATEAVETSAARTVTRFVDGVEVRAGGQTLRGTVDLGPTLERIESGGTFPHRNDGSVFMNREGLLPRQSPGYYREFVHPTPGISGPGPQRIIQGQRGELFYTPDHYGSFIPLN